MASVRERILRRIRQSARGQVFSPKDFLDVASRSSVDDALWRLTRGGVIRRIGRGLYDYPRTNPELGGELSPDVDRAARAAARKHRWAIVPEPNLAANMLGLSRQVPAKIVYLSDGPTKTLTIGRRTIHFKHARPKSLRAKSEVGALVIQALRHLGQEGVTAKALRHLRERLNTVDRRRFLADARYAPDWIYEVARTIAKDA